MTDCVDVGTVVQMGVHYIGTEAVIVGYEPANTAGRLGWLVPDGVDLGTVTGRKNHALPDLFSERW